MRCDYVLLNKGCSPACVKFHVPCPWSVRMWIFRVTRWLTNDPVLTVVGIALLVLVYLL